MSKLYDAVCNVCGQRVAGLRGNVHLTAQHQCASVFASRTAARLERVGDVSYLEHACAHHD